MTSPGFSDSDLSLIETFKEYGADVIELAIVDPAEVNVSMVKTALIEHGLERPVICGAFGKGRDLRGTHAEVQASSTYILELIHLAQELGAKVVCGPMYSETGRISAHTCEEREAQLEQIAQSLRPLCGAAEEAGVTLALEPLNRFETDCINTLEQATALIERVDHSALKIHIDTFHMNIEEADSAAAIMKAGDHIGHVHASASHRGIPGEDQVRWAEIFHALKQIEYHGDMIIESFSPDNEVIAKATCIWRDLYESPQQLAVQGLEFLKKEWAAQPELTSAV